MNYYDIKIIGKDVKRFIRNLYKSNINFYNIKYIDNYVIIRVNHIDYLKIKDIKTIYEIDVIKCYGIVKYRKFINRYKIIFICLVIGFLFLLLLTNLIFNVEVISSNIKLNKDIKEELKNYGISKYHFVVNYNKKEKIKKDILNKYKDRIEWLEINRIGTKYEINIEERKINNNKKDYTPRNIVAKKSGIITKINATNGEIISKVNQYVRKGDILISGNIHKKEDIVASLRAEGIVYAETWYTVSIELPYSYKEKHKTKRKDKNIVITFLNHKYKLFSKHFKDYESNSIFSLKNSLIPIGISINNDSELKITDQVNTIDNSYFLASEIAISKLKENLGNNIEIIYEKKLKTIENNSKIEVVIFYKVIENITEYKEITEEEKIGN